MKIQIPKSAKGNEQKQNKLTKPPNPESPKSRQAHMPTKKQKQGKEIHQTLGNMPSQNLKQPEFF